MYVCKHACMYVCMYVCMQLCMYAIMYVNEFDEYWGAYAWTKIQRYWYLYNIVSSLCSEPSHFLFLCVRCSYTTNLPHIEPLYNKRDHFSPALCLNYHLLSYCRLLILLSLHNGSECLLFYVYHTSKMFIKGHAQSQFFYGEHLLLWEFCYSSLDAHQPRQCGDDRRGDQDKMGSGR